MSDDEHEEEVVEAVEEPIATNNLIINGCLSFVRCAMLTKDNHAILDSVCTIFDFPTVKTARHVLFKHVDKESYKNYRGPSNKTMNEKLVHVTNLVIERMRDLDSKKLLPQIVCPSEELNRIPRMKSSVGQLDQRHIDERFDILERSVAMLKEAIEARPVNPEKPKSAVPTVVRERLAEPGERGREAEQS